MNSNQYAGPAPFSFTSVPRANSAPANSLTLAAGVGRVSLAILIVPQIPMLLWWLQSRSIMHFRGWINSEYLLLLGVALLFPSRAMVALLTAELTVALIEPIAHLYYFSVGDVLPSLRYLAFLPLHTISLYLCLLLAYVGGCVTTLRFILGDRRLPAARAMAALALVLAFLTFVADTVSGRFVSLHPMAFNGRDDMHSMHAMRNPVASLLVRLVRGRMYVVDQPVALPSALGQAVAGLPPHSQPDIVLVLTESWGLANDERVNHAQTLPYMTTEIAHKYRVQAGTVEFHGSTTSGETRELCGDSEGRSNDPAEVARLSRCWPRRFEADGYKTLAVHGFTPTMYGREQWYGSFGFTQAAFLPQLQRDGAAVCDGAFVGICDDDVASWIGDRLVEQRGGSPLFVHWVTLNSHLPVAPIEDVSHNCAPLNMDPRESLCAWFNRILLVQNSVARLALKNELRPTMFVVVGDHAPPFLRPDFRQRFSQTSVPYVILTPREQPEAPRLPTRLPTDVSRRNTALRLP